MSEIKSRNGVRATKRLSVLLLVIVLLSSLLPIGSLVQAATTYDLTVTTDGSGSVDLDPTGGSYAADTEVTLTANAETGWTFDHWDGDLTGSDNPATITMDSDKNVTAYFIETVSGTVTLDGAVSSGTADDASSISFTHTTGTGTNRLLLVGVSGNNYETVYNITSVTFTPTGESAIALTEVGEATNGDGRRTAIWSLLDPPSGATGTLAVTFSDTVNYGIVAGAANFAGVDQTTPLGTFTSAYSDDDTPTVTLTGLDGDELVFDSLYVGGDPAAAVTVGADQDVLWDVLEGTEYLRSASSTEQAIGDSVTMSWTRDEAGRWAIAAVPINPAAATTYDLTVNIDGNGSVDLDPTGGSYAAGTVVTLTANAETGWTFDHWDGDLTGSDNPTTITMDDDKTITAYFTETPASAITYIGDIGTATSKTSGTTLVITTTDDVAAGDDIIVVCVTDPYQNLTVSVTDSAGNTYTEALYAVNTGNLRAYIFYSSDVNALPSGGTITITTSNAVTAKAAVASVFSGLANIDPLDQTQTGTDSSDSPSSGATATTEQADELLIGAVGTEGPVEDDAGSWLNDFTAGPRDGTTGDDDDSNITASMGWQIVSATGEYTAQKSDLTSRDWAAMIATFKARTAGPHPTITITGIPLSAFSSEPGEPSAEQHYTVSGSNLTDDISITAPADFEISLTSGSDFASSLVLPQSGGSVSATTIYVRFNRATEGTSTGNITHISSEATTRNVAVSGTAAGPILPSFNIILGRPTDTSVTANIIPNQDGEAYIEYGTVSGTYTDQTSTFACTADEPVEVVINGLTANTEHFYRIRFQPTGETSWTEGDEYSFITQRASGETFTFTIISDSHLGQYGGQTEDEYALYEQALLNVEADNPDFHIDLGDTFAMDPSPLGTGMTVEEADAAYYVQRPYMGIIGSSIPILFALGNHENEEGWNWDDVFEEPDQSLAIVGIEARKKYIPNPIPDDFYTGNTDPLPEEIGGDYLREDYYAWEWGDALFVVLDPFHYSMTWPNDNGTGYGGEGQDGEASGDRWDWTLGIDQYLWFKDVLETSDATYKFVFCHHVTGGITPYGRGGISAAPYFEWGGYNADDTWGWDTERPASEGWDVPIHQLMVENGVDIFFHGHDHIYAYEELDGIVYLECPKPDDAGYDWEPYGYGYTEGLYPDGLMIQNSGHIRVTVSPDEVTVDYVRAYLSGDGTNGEVAHTFTIDPNETESGILGDVNGDDVVNSTDALIILSCDGGLDTSSYCPMNCGDVNGDGLVNSTDALIILSYDAGMDVSYSVGESGCPSSVTQCPGCSS